MATEKQINDERVQITDGTWVQHVAVYRRIYDSLDATGKALFWTEAARMAAAADRWNAADPVRMTASGGK